MWNLRISSGKECKAWTRSRETREQRLLQLRINLVVVRIHQRLLQLRINLVVIRTHFRRNLRAKIIWRRLCEFHDSFDIRLRYISSQVDETLSAIRTIRMLMSLASGDKILVAQIAYAKVSPIWEKYFSCRLDAFKPCQDVNLEIPAGITLPTNVIPITIPEKVVKAICRRTCGECT